MCDLASCTFCAVMAEPPRREKKDRKKILCQELASSIKVVSSCTHAVVMYAILLLSIQYKVQEDHVLTKQVKRFIYELMV